jgi:nucleotide-binding universal stress UspA family protein
MSLRSLLVHLNSVERSKVRLNIAADLARFHGARLTGLFAEVAATDRDGGPPPDPGQAAAASREAFIEATKGLNAEWIDLDRGDEDAIVKMTTDLARHFDLIVIGQRRPDNSRLPPDFAEHLIINSGRPVLVLPYSGDFPTIGKRPIFAWSNSGPSARGFADGMMLVAPRAEALVVGLCQANDATGAADQKESLRLAINHLAAHEICAKPEQLTLSDIGLMDALLNHAMEHRADLLAIGAFGGGGYPLFSRGSGSRYMLRHMTAPVLFSH